MTVNAGDDILADDINDLTPQWISYTPTWGAATTPPVLGNGSLVGRYAKVGTVVHVAITLTAGSTTTFGTGRWTFALPAAVAAPGGVLTALAVDDSGTSRYAGAAWLTPGTGVFAIAPGAGGNGWANTSPFTWATADSLQIGGTYQSSS